ncbi:MAG: ABC transporter ATP-binding protein [Cyanobacteria bacterium J06632_22]
MKTYLSKVLYVLSGKGYQLAMLLIAFVFASLLEALGIGLIGPFLSIVADPSIVKTQPFLRWLTGVLNLTTESQAIIGIGLLVMLLFCFKAVAYFLCKIHIYRFSYRQKKELEKRLVHTYLHIPYLFHLNHNSAVMIKNIVVESYQLAANCLVPLLEVVANIVIVVVLLTLLAFTDLSLLVVALAILLPVSIIFARISRRVRNWGAIKSDTQGDMVRAINHGLGGLKETKVIGCEDYFERDLATHATEFSKAAVWVEGFYILPRITIETILVLFLLAFIVFSQLMLGRTLEDLTSVMGVFAVASIRLLPAASQSLSALTSLRESSYALDMLYHDLKELEHFGRPNRGPAPQPNLAGHNPSLTTTFNYEITLEQLSYRYPSVDKPAIQDLSLTIRKGESIALVGKSGSGKTTLVDIVLGLLQPESGDIKVDGVSVYNNLRAWQNLLGYIPQSIFLSDETIEQNIAFGVPADQIDPERLWEAIQAAQLEDLIATLPEGVKTPVGERGVRLSGGQRQRIGIARALYHGREILVLDEATSALDTETEQRVSAAINALAGSKTLIIIAHRFSTIEQCDRIYRLDQGRLQQSGTYEEVISSPSA